MDSSDLASYVSHSSFVKKYAFNKDGFEASLPASDVIDSSEAVVVFDALLRKHYVWLDVDAFEQLTGLSEGVVSDVLDSFVSAGIVVEKQGEYQVNKERDEVKELRDLQIELLGEVSED